jgi:hypothetical protein
MADALAEFQAIVEARNEAFRKLSLLEAPALEHFNALVNKKNMGQVLTAEEQDQMATAEATLGNVHHGIWIVGQISLQAMNDSALLRDIRNALEGITDDLTKAKAKIEKIGKIAGTVADAISILVALAEKLPKAAGPAALLT